jgi:hypothetical protein
VESWTAARQRGCGLFEVQQARQALHETGKVRPKGAFPWGATSRHGQGCSWVSCAALFIE